MKFQTPQHPDHTRLDAGALALLTALALILASGPASAGGWVPAPGDGYLKVWGRALVGGAAYFDDGEVRELGVDFTDLALNAYAEVGIYDGWALVGFTNPAGRAEVDGQSQGYVGTTEVGVRRRLLAGALNLAIEAHYGFAPGVGDGVVASGTADGRAWAYAPTVSTHLGSAELQLGHGLSWGWVSASVGARAFSDPGLDPAITGFAQVGTSLAEGSVVLDLHAALYEPLGEIGATNPSGAGQTRYLGLGLGVSWWFHPRLGVNVGFDGVLYAASNAATPSLMLGVEAR